jgi:hypothetical protein
VAAAVAMAVVICSADSLNLGTGRFPAPRRVADISDPQCDRASRFGRRRAQGAVLAAGQLER